MENIIQRVKGRLPSQLRDISCEQGIITKADGSSRLIIDKSKVIVGIYGPIKANFTKDEESDKAILNVIFRKQRGQTGSSEAEKQEFIRNTFEDAIFLNLYPRMEITIDIQVLSDDGSILSCAINAVQLALLNSGISMKYTVAAISLCFKENILFLDPTLNEEQNTQGGGTFVIPSNGENLFCSCFTYGILTEDEYDRILDASLVGVKKYFEFYRLSIR